MRFVGSIRSPYYPGLYLNNMKRFWTITVQKGQHILLFLTFLNLEFHKNCKRDAVVIMNSRYSKTQTRYCGSVMTRQPVFMSAGNSVIVMFMSDERGVGTGFELSYLAVPGKYRF